MTVAGRTTSVMSATSPFQIGALGFRRAQNRDDGHHRIEHHQAADIEIGILDAVDAQDLPGDDRDQPAAVDLCDLITRAGARGAIAGREILGIEGRDRAVAEAENKAEADDLGDRRQNESCRC